MAKQPSDFSFNRFHVDLSTETVRVERVHCEDMEDVLGGIARGFKVFAELPPTEPYAPEATLLMNLGALSGTTYMTGLRTFFQGYSPLKGAPGNGAAATMWTAGSGKLGPKLRWMGVDEVLFTGRCKRPTTLRLSNDDSGGVKFEFLDAADLVGQRVNAKMQALHARYPDAHMAVIGPAGENYENVRFASIALSTVNQLKSGEPKPRFCGRGGFGGVMGSKNLIAIVADGNDVNEKPTPEVKAINMDIAKGKGSIRYRDAKRNGGLGGTWSIYSILGPIFSLPENNFNPTDSVDNSKPLYREEMEASGDWTVKDESCFACGIRCHKNVYDKDGKFHAKLDYEPLNLLSSNLGLFEPAQALEMVALADDLGMDAISLGGSLSYAMDHNARNGAPSLLGGVTFGEFDKARQLVIDCGEGRAPELGQGAMRMAAQTGKPEYAMHSKGVEYPAYLPHTNPGYPFALAGGHMSMRTYLLVVFEKEVGMDYWVEAITTRGTMAMRDDVLGICKFARSTDQTVCEAMHSLFDLDVNEQDLTDVVRRTYLRGWKVERSQGFETEDYSMPDECHDEHPNIDLPYFNTREFFTELREKVVARFDEMLANESL